jgi:hypothetical protein
VGQRTLLSVLEKLRVDKEQRQAGPQDAGERHRVDDMLRMVRKETLSEFMQRMGNLQGVSKFVVHT